MMTQEEKVGQMLLAGFEGLQPPEYILDWLREGRIGGVILFARNVENPAQVAELTRRIHAAAKYPALIGIDQEGGIVARLRRGFTESPGAMALSAAHDAAEGLTERMSNVLAEEMRALGINWTYAPVVDISYNINNPTVGTRSYGEDKDRVSRLARAAVRGFQRGGVAACAKHFPGLGNTDVDTHLALPTLDASVDEFLANDLPPYRAVLAEGVATIMTTHTCFTALDTEHPATLSSVIVPRLLRESLGYAGVVTTDCMEMKAIADHYGPGESAILAALAGIDLILFSHTRSMQEAAYTVLLEAVTGGRVPGVLIEAANVRISALKQRYAINKDEIATGDIRSQRHLALAQETARAGTVLLQADENVFPLKLEADWHVGMIEFAYDRESQVEDPDAPTAFHAYVKAQIPKINTLTLMQNALTPAMVNKANTIAAESHILILATRNAHMLDARVALARDLMARARNVVLVCLRNPYDAGVLREAGTIICTCGDSEPSLQAAIDALLGHFLPMGKLPVTVDGFSA